MRPRGHHGVRKAEVGARPSPDLTAKSTAGRVCGDREIPVGSWTPVPDSVGDNVRSKSSLKIVFCVLLPFLL